MRPRSQHLTQLQKRVAYLYARVSSRSKARACAFIRFLCRRRSGGACRARVRSLRETTAPDLPSVVGGARDLLAQHAHLDKAVLERLCIGCLYSRSVLGWLAMRARTAHAEGRSRHVSELSWVVFSRDGGALASGGEDRACMYLRS